MTPLVTSVWNVLSFLLFLVFIYLSSQVSANNDTEKIGLDYSGSCAFKGWAAVAVCRKDFVDRLEGQKRNEKEECCLYRILEACAQRNAIKLCGNATDTVIAKHLKKYQDMMKPTADCKDITADSFDCFWISWENYVSCFIFLIVTLLIDVYIVIWYIKQTDIDRTDKKSLVDKHSQV